MSSDKPQAKVPLHEAVLTLSTICERIENGETIDETLSCLFENGKLALADAVDRRIALLHVVKGLAAEAKSAKEEWSSRVYQLNKIEESIKARTKEAMKIDPELPYKGTIGKLALQKSPAKLVLDVATYDERLPNVLNPIDLKERVFPTEVVEKHIYYTLNKAKVKEMLKKGEKFLWARLVQDDHVRVRK